MEEKVEKLSEGYDFIEESCGLYDVPLSFEEKNDVIDESEGTHSPFKIIGVCKGVFQPCGEFSRNNRLYEADHWNHVLENAIFQDRLRNRDLLGMVGHMDKRIDDKDISEGKVSHVVSKLEIREDKQGKPFLYGEMEIFDTPAGRNLKALYEGGANLYVSSRGAGKLLPVPGQTYKKVDKNSYFCETFDVVRRPGFLKAKPLYEEIKESEEQSKPKFSVSISEATLQPTVATNEEVEVLKEQIDKLAKIIEKVVDDVYEVEEPVEESSEAKGALIGTLALLANSNISEGLFEQIVEIIKKSKEKQ